MEQLRDQYSRPGTRLPDGAGMIGWRGRSIDQIVCRRRRKVRTRSDAGEDRSVSQARTAVGTLQPESHDPGELSEMTTTGGWLLLPGKDNTALRAEMRGYLDRG